MTEENIIDLKRRLRAKRTAELRERMDKNISLAQDFPSLLCAFVADAYDAGTPPYYIARALRECEAAVQDVVRERRGHRKPGRKSKGEPFTFFDYRSELR